MKRFVVGLLLLVAVCLAQQGVRLVDGNGVGITTGASGKFFDSGITTLPGSTTLVSADNIRVAFIHCANTTSGAVTLSMTDNQASPVTYWPAVSVAANSVMVAHYDPLGLPMKGIKWNAGATSSINCQIVGTDTSLQQ